MRLEDICFKSVQEKNNTVQKRIYFFNKCASVVTERVGVKTIGSNTEPLFEVLDEAVTTVHSESKHMTKMGHCNFR